ncbi:MAG: hypothetical protein HRU20_13325 [Pseudomonadales bacterium]|nr:hypothetical protein [Pseudomonadales bacterium]
MRSSKFLLTAMAATIASSMSIMGCKDDIQASTPDTSAKAKSGVVIDSIVEGLAYSAEPSGKSGITQADGRFDYTQGDTVIFSFGDIQLPAFKPENNQSTIVSVYDIANDDEALAQEIGRFLQTLDEDGDVNNGIQLPDANKLTSDYSDLSFTDPESLDGSLSTMITELALSPRLVVTAEEAQIHMHESLDNALEFTQTWLQTTFDEEGTEQNTALIDTQSTVVVKSGAFNVDDFDGIGIMWKFSSHPVFDVDPDYLELQDGTAQFGGLTCYFLLTQTRPSGGDIGLACDEYPISQAMGIWDIDAGVLEIRSTDEEGNPENYLALSLVQGTNMQTTPPIMYSYWDAVDDAGEPVGDAEVLILGDLNYFTPTPPPEPIALTLNVATTDQTSVYPFPTAYSLAVDAGEYYTVDLSNFDNNAYVYVCDDDSMALECNIIAIGLFDTSTASMALTFQATFTGDVLFYVLAKEEETTVIFDIIAKAANINALVLESTASAQTSIYPNSSVYTLQVEQDREYQIQLSNQDEDALLAACTSLSSSQYCAASELIATAAYTANTPGAGLSFTAVATGTIYVYVLAQNEATTLSFDIHANDITSAP